MEIVNAQKNNLQDIMRIFSDCISYLKSREIYQWNEFYPTSEDIEHDIENKTGYILNHNGNCCAYFAIDENQAYEYSTIDWNCDAKKVLVLHRLAVDPKLHRNGFGREALKFIDDFAIKNSYDCIRLDAYGPNKTSNKFYVECGYTKTGIINFPHKKEDFYCYEKICK
ncbi:MAG: GNAT family N-acetyltransferase [Clostridioides sp.]|nr:GNAT family N-acetyltransferase [Clostridioides sp.]